MVLLATLILALTAPVASGPAFPDPEPASQCDHDLDLVINWTGSEWALTSPSPDYPPFEACRGRRVTWTLGDTPGNPNQYLAWVHIAPRFFVADGTLETSTGFAAVTASKPITLRVREDAGSEALEYAVLILNVNALNPGQLKKLDEDLRGRRYGQARQFEGLTFVQQGSPPRMIIK